jgi:hypothetical protein
MKAKIYPAGEVAYVLRQALGPLREWSDCLSDMRRGKTDLDGFRLLPTCRIRDGRAWRPAYEAGSVTEFIREIRALHPEIMTRTPARGFEIEIDPADERAWFVRKLSPMTKH